MSIDKKLLEITFHVSIETSKFGPYYSSIEVGIKYLLTLLYFISNFIYLTTIQMIKSTHLFHQFDVILNIKIFLYDWDLEM